MANIDSTIGYTILFTASALILLLLGLVVSYLSLLGKFLKLKERKEKEIGKDLDIIYKETQVKMQKIISDALGKSTQILSSLELFSERQNELITDELSKSRQLHFEMYQKTLDEAENRALEKINEIPNELKESFSKKFDEIIDQYSKNLDISMQDYRKKIASSFETSEIEIQKYREERYKQIDSSIVDIIQKIAKRVLIKQISPEEHEKLVTKAIEEAKNAGVFSGD